MRARPRPSIITLAGFRSRCSTPRSCAAASPAQSCARDLERLVRREPADALQERGEVLAVHVLHREEVLAVDLADVVDAADVGVRDLARDAHLGVEALEAVLLRSESPRQELQRDRLAELQVVGAIDLAHAAAPEQADDPVALGEHRAGREAAGLDRIGRGQPADLRGRRAAPPRRLRDRGRCDVRRQLRYRRNGLAAFRAEARVHRRLRRARRASRRRGVHSLLSRSLSLVQPRARESGLSSE